MQTLSSSQILYPDSDGQPMADNTLQFRWIVTIKENLESLFAQDPDVFVAGDLLWYPVEGHPEIRRAPDALVVFGRPKGNRGSYRQWQEKNIPPHVVFEVLSPGNRPSEMTDKWEFYNTYGVEEYYIYDPDSVDLDGWQRQGEQLRAIRPLHSWISPRLGIRFDLSGSELRIFRPDGQPFLTFAELDQLRDLEKQRADQAEQRADQAEKEIERLQARLRALGVDPAD
jgi:Uma2 family endonuclease